MKKWRKWMANTAFDAAMPLGFAILFEAGPVMLVVVAIALVIFAVKKVRQISEEKKWEREHENEVGKDEK